MTGYTRADTTDQIANGNIIDAVPLDAEFEAIQTAFASVGGHSHDGSVGEGAPILTIGPTQNVVASGSSLTPKTDNTIDLGSSSFEWKDLWVDGTANIDSLVADTADINAGTIDNTVIGGTTPEAGTFTNLTATSATVGGAAVVSVSASQILTNKTINLANNTLAATSAQIASAVSDETGSGFLVFSVSPALTGTPTAPTAVAGTNTTQIATTAHVFAERSNTATLTNKTLTSPVISGGTINSAAIGNTTPSTGVFTTLSATTINLSGTPLGAVSTESVVPITKGGTGATTASAGRVALGAAAIATSSAGVGQFTAISSTTGGDATLPSGGTWKYFLIRTSNINGGVSFVSTGMANGGTVIGPGVTDQNWNGWAERVS